MAKLNENRSISPCDFKKAFSMPDYNGDEFDDVRNSELPDLWVLKIDGCDITVCISPFSWMRQQAFSQNECGFSFSLKGEFRFNCEAEFIQISCGYFSITQEKINSIISDWISKNGIETLQNLLIETAKSAKKFKARINKCNEKIKKQKAEKKLEGFKYYITAQITPEHDSDSIIYWFSKRKPRASTVKKILDSKGSYGEPDFKVETL